MKIFLIFLFAASASAIKIECEFNDIGYALIGYRYTCIVKSMNFSDNPTDITAWSGMHINGRSDDDVTFIWWQRKYCPGFNLKVVPKKFTNFFPNIRGLVFERCSFEELQSDDLVEYKNLQWFEVSETYKLERIPGNYFACTPDITFLNFHGNRIKYVGEGAFEHLKNLKIVYFAGNDCADSTYYGNVDLLELFKKLKAQCPDKASEIKFDPTYCPAIATTTTSTTSTTQDSCSSLKLENSLLIAENQNFINQIRELNLKMEEKTVDFNKIAKELRERIKRVHFLEDQIVDLKKTLMKYLGYEELGL